MELAPGSRLGVYEILSPLGAGGMGEVYRARDTRLGREVAIKVLPAAFAGDAERMARFEREARLLAVLNHPGIATIHGLEEADSPPRAGDGAGSRARRWPSGSPRARCRSTKRSRSRGRSRRPSSTRTSTGSSIAT